MANAEHSGRTAEAFGATAVGGARARLRAARLGLWLLAAVLAVRQVALVLTTPSGERLTDLETWVGPEGVLLLTITLLLITYVPEITTWIPRLALAP